MCFETVLGRIVRREEEARMDATEERKRGKREGRGEDNRGKEVKYVIEKEEQGRIKTSEKCAGQKLHFGLLEVESRCFFFSAENDVIRNRGTDVLIGKIM